MTVTMKTRSHRTTYMILLLMFAVALSTILMVTGERAGASERKSEPSQHSLNAPAHTLGARTQGCFKA